jgi:methyl-accepting chemotaxis protein
MTLRKISIFSRVSALIAACVLTLTAIIFVCSSQLINQQLTQKAYSNLADDVRVIDVFLESRGNQFLSIAEMVQNLRRVQSAYETSPIDKQALQVVADETMDQFKTGLTTFTDAKGVVMARGNRHGQNGDSNYDLYGMQKVFTSKKPFIGFDTARTIPFLYCCRYPITNKNGDLVGVFTVGFDLGKEQFIDIFKKYTGDGDVTLYLKDEQGEYVAHQSTFKRDDGTRPTGVKLDSREVLETVTRQAKTLTTISEFAGKPFYTSYKPLLRESQVFGVLAVSTDVQENYASQNRITRPLLWIMLAASLVIIIVTMLFVRRITRPISALADASKAVAHGDHDASLPPERIFSGELLALHGSLVTMLDSLKCKIAEACRESEAAARESEIACRASAEAEEARAGAERAKSEGIMQAANQLETVVEIATAASARLLKQIESASKGAKLQSERVGETATAMEEMNATVLEVARNATQAADNSDKTRDKALEGAVIVEKVVQGIESVQRQAMALKSDMGELGKQAQDIGRILNVISDIADQTNLLALNAAIEAARAGDAGRGFAVVADEVRKLAEKTMTATKEVGEAIDGIQRGAKSNMDNVDLAVTAIGDATGLANGSGETLKEIVALANKASDQVDSIATASEEQSKASEEINRSIEQVASISYDTSEAMAQATEAVSELTRQTTVLKELIESMQSDAGGGVKRLSA